MSILLANANALRIPLRDGSVQCVVTSPPYWNLRDYGISGQLGLEPTWEEYVENMVLVFREVRRVMRHDAICFLNLGDSYGHGTSAARKPGQRGIGQNTQDAQDIPRHGGEAKQLLGIPWRVAFALQADGWWLRSDIIWAKPNPMPESVTDRPTKAHEYLFLLAKSQHYFYDADAVRENYEQSSIDRLKYPFTGGSKGGQIGSGRNWAVGEFDGGKEMVEFVHSGRNRRSVWTLPTMPYSGAAKIDRARRVPKDAVSDGMIGIPLPSCPVHGDRFAQVARDFYGGPSDDRLTRILDTYNHLAQARRAGYVPTPPTPDAANETGNWGYSPREYSPTAIDHNNEIHRMALALDSNPAYIPFVEIADRIGDRSRLLSSFVRHLCIYGSNILPVDCDARLLVRTPGYIVGKSSLPIPPECECLFYEYYTINSDHFATYPPALVEPCIKAGTSERGCCPKCGAPWERMVECRYTQAQKTRGKPGKGTFLESGAGNKSGGWNDYPSLDKHIETTGWRKTCSCPEADPTPAIVFDPFAGSGTTLLVARQLGRHGVGLDLSYAYLHEQARARLQLDALEEWTGGIQAGDDGYHDLPLFGGTA